MKLIKRFFCWMGWHSLTYDTVYYDGHIRHAKCRWCGKYGIVDTIGKFF